MKCPSCQKDNDRVIDSRPSEDGSAIRRRRECNHCGARFTTYERVEHLPLMVIKRGGNREPFHRDKIVRGLVKACEKTTLTAQDIEEIVDLVEKDLLKHHLREVRSKEIGEVVMQYLLPYNQVAYIRFASVYREFKDVRSFIDTIRAFSEMADHL